MTSKRCLRTLVVSTFQTLSTACYPVRRGIATVVASYFQYLRLISADQCSIVISSSVKLREAVLPYPILVTLAAIQYKTVVPSSTAFAKDRVKMMQRLWGDWFYYPKRKAPGLCFTPIDH